jgi:hypothetical protein
MRNRSLIDLRARALDIQLRLAGRLPDQFAGNSTSKRVPPPSSLTQRTRPP